MQKFCRKSCNACDRPPVTATPTKRGHSEPCTNLENDFLCSYWMSFDYCTDKFQTFMSTYCRKTCRMCTAVGFSSYESEVASSTTMTCRLCHRCLRACLTAH